MRTISQFSYTAPANHQVQFSGLLSRERQHKVHQAATSASSPKKHTGGGILRNAMMLLAGAASFIGIGVATPQKAEACNIVQNTTTTTSISDKDCNSDGGAHLPLRFLPDGKIPAAGEYTGELDVHTNNTNPGVSLLGARTWVEDEDPDGLKKLLSTAIVDVTPTEARLGVNPLVTKQDVGNGVSISTNFLGAEAGTIFNGVTDKETNITSKNRKVFVPIFERNRNAKGKLTKGKHIVGYKLKSDKTNETRETATDSDSAFYLHATPGVQIDKQFEGAMGPITEPMVSFRAQGDIPIWASDCKEDPKGVFTLEAGGDLNGARLVAGPFVDTKGNYGGGGRITLPFDTINKWIGG